MEAAEVDGLVGCLAKFTVLEPPEEKVTLQGIIFTVDSVAGIVVLVQPAPPQATTIINLAHVLDVHIEDKNPNSTHQQYYCGGANQHLPASDVVALKKRLESNCEGRLLPPAYDHHVSIACFELFNSLTKQFPVVRALKWGSVEQSRKFGNNGPVIVIFESIFIMEPWDGSTSPTVQAGPEADATNVDRVKLVVQKWQANFVKSAPTTTKVSGKK
eukprot:PhF_6_TR26555/c0_g1_i1/m.38412